MKDILRPVNRAILSHFATSHVLLAFDFDGTLAPISPLRDAVSMRPSTLALLQQACSLFPCAVVSGRSRADVTRRLAGARVPYIIGNHGLEPSAEQPRFEGWATRTLPVLERVLSACEGVDIEHKRYSISIHYRNAPSKARTLREILRAVDDLLERPRIVGGKLVVNLVPANAPHKGSALAALAERQGMERVIYVGDDQTDEDVFANASPSRLLGIRVGRSKSSAARYYVRDQPHVDDLLEALITVRARTQAREA